MDMKPAAMASNEKLRVVKMNGAKNDFVLIDDRPAHERAYGELAKTLCDRSVGVGADGLLLVRDAPGFAAEMRVFNADGGEPEMCGNGVRCVARYLAERGAGNRFTVKTLAGPIEVTIISVAPEYLVRIDMGVPTFPEGERALSIVAAGKTWRFLSVSLGNPHAVIFVEDTDAIDLERFGAEVAKHPRFPNGTNVHIAQVVDRHTLRVRHYERGVGLTQACGTGAVACGIAAMMEQRCDMPISVRVPGGTLGVSRQQDGHMQLTGPAVTEFERTIDL
jgi:diaminopimelate epimerase